MRKMTKKAKRRDYIVTAIGDGIMLVIGFVGVYLICAAVSAILRALGVG